MSTELYRSLSSPRVDPFLDTITPHIESALSELDSKNRSVAVRRRLLDLRMFRRHKREGYSPVIDLA
jgi:hypothetical protein